jgi:hypothetical protein
MDTETQRLLIELMGTLDYEHVSEGTFRANWSTSEVEHFLYWTTQQQGVFLAGDFGFRNWGAETYARECMAVYGGLRSPSTLTNGPTSDHRCYMRYDLARLTPKRYRWVVTLPTASNESLRAEVQQMVQLSVAALSPVITVGGLYDLLKRDEEWCPWYCVNGAIRAAQLVWLGKMLGVLPQEMETALQPRLREIELGLHTSMHPEVYISKLISHEPGASGLRQ